MLAIQFFYCTVFHVLLNFVSNIEDANGYGNPDAALMLPLDSAQSAAADRQFRRLSAALLPRAGARGPPAGRLSELET